jgi:3-oxoacyl-[acyl-carrier protein] reductase
MIQQKHGHIINMASINGVTPFAGTAVYAASKAGIIAFSEAMAMELEPYGIVVNAIAPGLVDTDMVKKIRQGSIDEYFTISGSRKLLTVEETAQWVLTLAGPLSYNLKGQTITIKG